MDALLNAAEYILSGVLNVIQFIIVAYAVLSWLIAFNVVNLRNQAVWQISRGLEAIAAPLLAPFQRFLPNMGGMDFSPILLFLVIGALQRFLLPAAFAGLHSLFGAPVVGGVI